MHRMAALMVLTLATAVARAEPDDYIELARQGIEAADAGDHAKAVKLLTAARAANPGEPNVLDELARELLATKDYARAREAAEAALAQDPHWAGPRMTLARILEATGKRADAAAVYRALFVESRGAYLEALARLGALDPKAADALRKPEFLEGPFPAVAAWCAKQKPACKDSGKLDDALGDITLGDATKDNSLHAARVVDFISFPGTGSHQVDGCAVALAVGREWWVGPVVTNCSKDGGGIEFFPSTRELSLRDGVLTLWLRVGVDSRKFGVFSDDSPHDHHIVCGVGPSNKPSCVEDWRVQPTFRAFP
jgi:hypothetical protein